VIAPVILRHMPNNAAQLDAVFRALADPTRRAVIERLNRGPAAMTELSQPFKMALPSFSQHLDVLKSCGLVSSRKSGRVRTYRLVPRPLKAAENWLSVQRTQWVDRLDRLDKYLMDIKEQSR
jgi:DNA-binding transcriptional ArsR family regulator